MDNLSSAYSKALNQAMDGRYFKRDFSTRPDFHCAFDVESFMFDIVGLIDVVVDEKVQRAMEKYSSRIMVEFETYLDGEPVGGKVREAVRQAIQKAIAETAKN